MSFRTWVAQRWRTAITQTKLLTRLCSRWNSQLRLSFNRRHFDLRAKRSFGNGDWDRHINVVALAREVFVRTNVCNDMKVASLRAETSAFSLAWNPHTRPCLDSGRNANFYCLGF